MLSVGQVKSNKGHSLSRRELLRVGGLSVIPTLAWPELNRHLQASETDRERSVILLWLWGGPSHLDTVDMKPAAPLEYRGPYRPISTSVAGTQICELLPKLARRSHQYTIIRSLHHESNDHGIAGTIGLTGSIAGAKSLGGQTLPGRRLPTHGSVVSRILGFEPGLPRFMTIGEHLQQGHRPITGEDAGYLGALYDPFRLDYLADQGVQIPDLQLIDGVSPSGIESRRQLLREFDRIAESLERSPQARRLDAFYEQAMSLLSSPKTRAVFDLEQEPDTLRRRYGRFRFGQSCLLARRLVQAGSRFVQVNWSSHVEPIEDAGDGGWDMHDRNFQQFQDRHAWMIDQSLTALLDDLKQRGMLDKTIVVAVGEFGRTPKINGKAGRDHWNQCYSGIVAGGGFAQGHIVGSSDPLGEHPVSSAMTPADLFCTVLYQMGIGTTELTSAGILPQGRLIESLIA